MSFTCLKFLGPLFYLGVQLMWWFLKVQFYWNKNPQSLVFFQEILMKPQNSTHAFKVCISIDKCGQMNSIHTWNSGDNIINHLYEVQKYIVYSKISE